MSVIITVEDSDDPYRFSARAVQRAESSWDVEYFRKGVLVSDGGIGTPPPYMPPMATLGAQAMTGYRVYLCGGDMRPGPREDCPDPLHDFPLPAGYVDASEEAASRLSHGWGNPRCRLCGLHGWTPGRPRKGEQLVRVRPEGERS